MPGISARTLASAQNGRAPQGQQSHVRACSSKPSTIQLWKNLRSKPRLPLQRAAQLGNQLLCLYSIGNTKGKLHQARRRCLLVLPGAPLVATHCPSCSAGAEPFTIRADKIVAAVSRNGGRTLPRSLHAGHLAKQRHPTSDWQPEQMCRSQPDS